jgi:peptide/nickel transport system ATP-binding protein
VTALLKVVGLRKQFPGRRLLGGRAPAVKAVDGISFELTRGETLGLVGESGSGKSTLGRTILQLEHPTAGSVVFDGQEIAGQSERMLRPIRRNMQMIFQDPQSSLDPRMKVGDIIAEPIVIHDLVRGRAARKRRVAELLDLVRLPAAAADRYAREFSGGQRQRIGIARAIAMNPRLVISDEAVSALDVSIQAQIINLLMDLQAELHFAHLFIAHDLAVVRHIADRIAVMFLGRIVEMAPSEALFAAPRHPYTRALLDAMPIPDPAIESGRTRSTTAPLRRRYPEALREIGPGHFVADFTPEDPDPT